MVSRQRGSESLSDGVRFVCLFSLYSVAHRHLAQRRIMNFAFSA
jgi:hypothetical protein